MTREEAIETLGHVVPFATQNGEKIAEAIDMAIEALSQPIVAKHFDIQSGYIYCSPQIAENVKVVVRCKDCRHGERDAVFVYCTRYYRRIGTEDYCSRGERREL